MRRRAIVLFCATALIASRCTAAAETFHSDTYGFSAEFGAAPDEQDASREREVAGHGRVLLPGRLFMSSPAKGLAFCVQVTSYPSFMAEPSWAEEIFDSSVEGILNAGENGKVLSSHRIAMGGFPARRVVAELDTGKHHVQVRANLILAGTRLFVVQVIDFSDPPRVEEANHFFESFKIYSLADIGSPPNLSFERMRSAAVARFAGRQLWRAAQLMIR